MMERYEPCSHFHPHQRLHHLAAGLLPSQFALLARHSRTRNPRSDPLVWHQARTEQRRCMHLPLHASPSHTGLSTKEVAKSLAPYIRIGDIGISKNPKCVYSLVVLGVLSKTPRGSWKGSRRLSEPPERLPGPHGPMQGTPGPYKAPRVRTRYPQAIGRWLWVHAEGKGQLGKADGNLHGGCRTLEYFRGSG